MPIWTPVECQLIGRGDFEQWRITARTEVLLAGRHYPGFLLKSRQRSAGECFQLARVQPDAPAMVAVVHLNRLEPEDEQPDIAFGADRDHSAYFVVSNRPGQVPVCNWNGRVPSYAPMKASAVEQIDWSRWQPTERATLCFVIRDGQILLIHKKRGLGAGKINGPGGRIEADETAVQGAIRETEEEVGVTPLELTQIGELFFEFLDGYKLHVAVFVAEDCSGTLIETSEAIPFWVEIDQIPYHEMWEDDPYWLPLLLSRNHFKGYFLFDGERLLSHLIQRT